MRPADIAASNRQRQPSSAALAAAIQATHTAIAHEADPEDKQQLASALKLLLGVQATSAEERSESIPAAGPHPASGDILPQLAQTLAAAHGAG